MRKYIFYAVQCESGVISPAIELLRKKLVMWVARLGSPSFKMKKRKPTPQAKKLYGELRKRDVNAVMEYFDGHKCVDIGIPDAYIYIEVDGENHLTDPSQIERDFERDHYSEVEGVHTIHISNRSIDEKVERIAEAISKVVDKRKAKVKRIID